MDVTTATHVPEVAKAPALADAPRKEPEPKRMAAPNRPQPTPMTAAPPPPEFGGDVRKLVEEVRARAKEAGVTLDFRIEIESGEVVIEVSDPETGDLIRRIPPETLAERLARLGGLEGFLTGLEG